MTKPRKAQAFLIFLWFCLVEGLYLGLRDKAYLPTAVGVCINLLFQYAAVNAIRQAYRPEKQEEAAFRRSVLRTYAKVAVPLALTITVFVGLVVLGAVSQKTFGWLCSSLMLISVVILIRLFQRLQREYGIRN